MSKAVWKIDFWGLVERVVRDQATGVGVVSEVGSRGGAVVRRAEKKGRGLGFDAKGSGWRMR